MVWNHCGAAPHPNEETPQKGRIPPFPAGFRGGDRILNRRLLRCERNLTSTANRMVPCGYGPLALQIRHFRFIPTQGAQQLQHSRIRHATAESRTRLWCTCGAAAERACGFEAPVCCAHGGAECTAELLGPTELKCQPPCSRSHLAMHLRPSTMLSSPAASDTRRAPLPWRRPKVCQ
jgi:hypothetical protein